MGYVVLHLDKSPDNEIPMTAHIARTKMPPNAIPELTYLNEELVEYPEASPIERKQSTIGSNMPD